MIYPIFIRSGFSIVNQGVIFLFLLQKIYPIVNQGVIFLFMLQKMHEDIGLDDFVRFQVVLISILFNYKIYFFVF